MRLIDAEPLEEILRLRRAQCSNDYGSLVGAISGCLKLVQLQPAILRDGKWKCRRCWEEARA